ncbi:MAG: S8 family serine peptidase [Bacteroidota bacterium]
MNRLLPAVAMIISCASLCFSQSNFHVQTLSRLDSRLQGIVHPDNIGAASARFQPMKSVAAKNNGKYPIIVYSNNIQDALQVGVQPITVEGEFFTAKATPDQIAQLSALGSVRYIALARRYKRLLDKSVPEIHADKLQSGAFNGTSYTGKNVILGFIDTGIDWSHLDFRSNTDTTQSRILWLWDQTTSGGSPAGFGYGTEYTQAQINGELGSSPAHLVKEIDDDGHGTHVAGIAAGDGSSSGLGYKGVAPDADIIFVKTTFNDDDIINGITYIRQKAVLAGKPFVINLSLGSQLGPHDGTDPIDEDIDSVLATPGRAIVVAAGNEGGDAIHADSTAAQGGTINYKFVIPSYTASGIAQNDYVEFDMWYGEQDQLTVSLTSPRGSVVTALSGNQVSTQTSTGDGQVEIDNASNGANPLDNLNECIIYIFDAVPNRPPRAGTWQMNISGGSITPGGGAYDIWLGDSQLSISSDSIPQFTKGYSFRKLVGSPGTSKKAITVGSYVTKYTWNSIDGKSYSFALGDRTGNYSTFTSMGPTRDGRQKPEVCAPGEVIISALSKDSTPDSALISTDGKHVAMQGTSMATPHVAGVAALLLQSKPTLTSDQLKNAMTTTARRDAFTGSSVSSLWGYGKIDATGAMGNVLSAVKSSVALPTDFSLDQNYPNPFNPSTEIRYTLPQHFKGNVSLTVFDVLGKKVATLVNQQQAEGEFSALWTASSVSSGVYFYILRAGNFLAVKKMMLMK